MKSFKMSACVTEDKMAEVSSKMAARQELFGAAQCCQSRLIVSVTCT